MQEKNNFALISSSPFWLEIGKSKEAIAERKYHYHDCYQLYYLYSGELYYFINDKTYLVKPGNLVLVKNYEIHCTTTASSKNYERLIIDFKKEFFSDILRFTDDINLFECFEKNIHIIKLNMQEQNRIESIFKSMINEYFSEMIGKKTSLKVMLIQLLTFINRHSEAADSEAQSYANSAHKTVSEVTAYINNNISDDLSLTAMSQKHYISTFYLSRIFKRITGMSFIEYVNGVRIKEAKRLLIKSELGVSEISDTVGYKSCTHFGRVFKEITGLSPSEFRKSGGEKR